MSYAPSTGRSWARTSLLALGLLGCPAPPGAGDPDRPAPGAVVPTAADPTAAASHAATASADSARPRPPLTFRAVPIDSGRPYRQLVRELGPDRLTLLLKLNRVDLDHLRAGDTLFLPADESLGPLDIAPFPVRVPALDSFPKFLVVEQRIQAFAAYELGHLVFWGPTSTGKRSTPTPNGLFHTTWKAKETRSTENAAWLLKWYFNFENHRGVSLHQYDLPGYPASHACVRLLAEDAEWIYRWADQWVLTANGARVIKPGTPVLVFGEYRFGDPAPWRQLGTDPAASTTTVADIAEALAGYRPGGVPAAARDSTG
ncbi:MAG: L,D-transpeptidase [Gemmatimonadales bacterium]